MQEREWQIRWSDKLNVNVPEIDDEHRQFVARVNKVNKAIVEGADKATIERLLDLMLMEASHHFWHEEQLLAEWKYPDRAVHAAKHAHITAQFGRMMQEFEQADVSFGWALKGLHIKQLLVDHLLTEDMKYRDFLRAQESARAFPERSERTHKRALVAA